MNYFLILMSLALFIIAVIISFYLFTIYCHPDEKGFGSSILSKIIIVAGMVIAFSTVALFSLDIANSKFI